MDSIPGDKLDKREENLHEKQPVSKKRRRCNPFIRMLLFFINTFLHSLFLFLLFIRGPVHAILTFFAGISMLGVLVYGGIYLFGGNRIPSVKIEMIIAGIVFTVLCLWVAWIYDTLLIRSSISWL
ncbi:hypothetical protein [Bartonella schoenbuchensis]|uniref:hypothetical protein n=1 Tax=Bartonella schoenbuchensis TaxID=165694 RepID=UPI0031455FBF